MYSVSALCCSILSSSFVYFKFIHLIHIKCNGFTISLDQMICKQLQRNCKNCMQIRSNFRNVDDCVTSNLHCVASQHGDREKNPCNCGTCKCIENPPKRKKINTKLIFPARSEFIYSFYIKLCWLKSVFSAFQWDFNRNLIEMLEKTLNIQDKNQWIHFPSIICVAVHRNSIHSKKKQNKQNKQQTPHFLFLQSINYIYYLEMRSTLASGYIIFVLIDLMFVYLFNF